LDDNGFLIKGTQYRIILLAIVLVVRERVMLLRARQLRILEQ